MILVGGRAVAELLSGRRAFPSRCRVRALRARLGLGGGSSPVAVTGARLMTLPASLSLMLRLI